MRTFLRSSNMEIDFLDILEVSEQHFNFSTWNRKIDTADVGNYQKLFDTVQGFAFPVL